MSNDLTELQQEYIAFLEQRDWTEFHTPQNVAQAINIEAGELLELFLWHDNLDSEQIVERDEFVEEVRLELADVVIYCMAMAHQLDFELVAAVAEKLERNDERFHPERAAEIRRRTRQWSQES